MAEASATTLELVLDFLQSKGFSDAESALRQQLDAEPEPQPTTDNFSVLESMLIRGRAAAVPCRRQCRSLFRAPARACIT